VGGLTTAGFAMRGAAAAAVANVFPRMAGVIHSSNVEAGVTSSNVEAGVTSPHEREGPPAPPRAGVDAGVATTGVAAAAAAAAEAVAADAIVLPEEPVDDRINDFTSAFCADTLSAIIFLVCSIMIEGASTPRSKMYCSHACSNADFNVSRAIDNGDDIMIWRNENLFKKNNSFQFYSIKL